MIFFFFKQKTAYEMRISDWSSDVCSSDLKKDGASTSSARTERGEYNIRKSAAGKGRTAPGHQAGETLISAPNRRAASCPSPRRSRRPTRTWATRDRKSVG